MKIDRITLRRISVPFDQDRHFRTSLWTITAKDAVVIEVVDSDGCTGWGECSGLTLPDYCPESTAINYLVLKEYIVPSVLRMRSFETVDDVLAAMSWIKGNNMARAGLEMAIWDLVGKRDGRSLAQMIGGVHDRVKIGVTVGLKDSVDELLAAVAGYVDEGFGRVKLKVGPGHDVDPVRAVRKAFPGLGLQVDANSAYDLEDPQHVAALRALDAFDLLLIEQPLGATDILDHSKLKKLLSGRTPLCLDECIHSMDDVKLADALDACDVINIKQGRVGGVTTARAIHDFWAVARRRKVWGGGMYETSLGIALNAALASQPGYSQEIGADISMSGKYRPAEYDIATPFFHAREDSTVTVPTGPGLGVEINHAMLERWTTHAETFSHP